MEKRGRSLVEAKESAWDGRAGEGGGRETCGTFLKEWPGRSDDKRGRRGEGETSEDAEAEKENDLSKKQVQLQVL